MKGYFDRALGGINDGRNGNNRGLNHGLNRISEFFPNVQQKTYYLVGASTGCGKTSFADDAFLYNPYEDYINNYDPDVVLDIDYWSFEIDITSKITKSIARQLLLQFGVALPVNYILSRGTKYKLKQEHWDLIVQLRDYYERIEDVLTIHEIPENPTGIWKYIQKKASTLGTVETRPSFTDPNRHIPVKFIPKKKKTYWLQIIDHIALTGDERGFTTKQKIDKLSEYMVAFRNLYSGTPVVIQQLSYDILNPQRAKLGKLTPTLADFGDSRYTSRDANFVFSLYSPLTHNLSEHSCGGQAYNIRLLQDSFRAFEILKGRDGGIGTALGLHFIGEVGTFRELPRASEMTQQHYDEIQAFHRNIRNQSNDL